MECGKRPSGPAAYGIIIGDAPGPWPSALGPQTFDLRLQLGIIERWKCSYEAGVADSLYTEDARPKVLWFPGLRAEV